jgi:glycosyltransferase involved in cell wall biosynthesis
MIAGKSNIQRRVILRNMSSPSDNVLMTAAIRDLHLCYPNQFLTDIRSSHPQLWENNPHITPLRDKDPEIEFTDCSELKHSPSGNVAHHALHSFVDFLNKRLNLNIKLSVLKGDIRLSNEEKIWDSQVAELIGGAIPFWIVIAGGAYDVTTKLWKFKRYQEILNYFKGKIQFVQVGTQSHFHPKLKGAIDLCGRTDIRQLVRLVYHAQGVLCPVTLLMHLTAAVEMKVKGSKNRECVVLVSGREPLLWNWYPHHQLIHVNGAFSCYDKGGCWKPRVIPLGNGSQNDQSKNLDIDVVGKLPRRMDLAASKKVIRHMETYFEKGAQRYLSSSEAGVVRRGILFAERRNWDRNILEINAFKKASKKYIEQPPNFPDRFCGRGIVICAGGARYFTCAWVCIRMLRRFGCSLPIQIWYLDSKEMDDRMKAIVAPYDVQCVNAAEVRETIPVRRLCGWELKPYAILNCKFKEVLFLDADNVPIVNPEFLFETAQFKKTGAIFWPDFGRLKPSRSIWDICDVPYRDEPEFESGQIVINKEKCWEALCLTMWYNEHSDFYFKHIHGDKETFHMSFRKLGQPFAMPSKPAQALLSTMCQHDFDGRRIFQHRNGDKWTLLQKNRSIFGFLFEQECKDYLQELDYLWHGRKIRVPKFSHIAASPKLKDVAEHFVRCLFNYRRVGFDDRPMRFMLDGTIEEGSGRCEIFWDLVEKESEYTLLISSESSVTCKLKRLKNGIWKGRWLNHEKMPVELIAITQSSPIKFSNKSRGKIYSKKPILFRAPLTGHTGYGLHASQIVTDFQRMGYQLDVRAICIEEPFASIPSNVRHSIVSEEPDTEWELLLHPPGLPLINGKKRIHFTMWESSRLHQKAVEILNQTECILVPSQWNASCFSASGVERPIRIVPLGINTQAFKYTPMDMSGPFVFGTAGRLESGGHRKGINQVIKAFQKAFPKQKKDVRLSIKVFPDCEVDRVLDSRIEFIQEYLDEPRMAKWFSKIMCFVSCSKCEGWGLMQHQALAVGRPLIGVKFGGVTEFFSEEMGYTVDFRLVPADGFYSGCGFWADPDEEHLIELMRQVYADRANASERGRRGAESVGGHSWAKSNYLLVENIKEIGFLK